MNNISQRDSFWNKVYDLAKTNKDIVVITADMGAPALDKFRRDLSSQFVNVGIAEQNAITLAAGMTLAGKKVFTYAIAPFITLRCLEQIRVEGAIMKIPITMVGVGAGFGYADSGPTHHLLEDIAIMRAMPDIMINNATDGIMASAFAKLSCESAISNYVRLDREVSQKIYNDDQDFSKGLSVLKESNDSYIITTGNMVHIALDVADQLKTNGLSVGVIDVYTYPINSDALVSIIKKGAKKLITLEEHFLSGGLGGAVCEVLNDNNVLLPVKRLGLQPEKSYSYKYGGREAIRSYYGIDKNSVLKTAENYFKKN